MNNPRMYEQESAIEDQTDTSDEEMLERVRQGMGNEGGPPPGSGMRWMNLEEDQQALLDNPSPENVQAFVQYWGEDNLPPELAQQAMGGEMVMPQGGGGGPY